MEKTRAKKKYVPLPRPATIDPGQLYSIEETMSALGGIARPHIYRIIKEKKLKVRKIGWRTVVPGSEITKFAKIRR